MPGAMCPFKSGPDRISFCNFQCTFWLESENSECHCLIKETLKDIIDIKAAVLEIKSRLELTKL